MHSLGIDIGYSSVKLVLLDDHNRIRHHAYSLHKGKIKTAMAQCLDDLSKRFDVASISWGAVTGSASRLLTDRGCLACANEVAAVVEGSLFLRRDARSIIEIGGRNARYITGFSTDDRSGIEIAINSDCAAGTGSFLEEQSSRLNIALDDYDAYAARGKSVPRIAGRCSVFAKTDITHHQQAGVAVEDILLGLSHAMVKNYRGSVMRNLPENKPILFVGGVAHNRAVVRAFRTVLKLAPGELMVPGHFAGIGALGTAVLARKNRWKIDVEPLSGFLKKPDPIFFIEEKGNNGLAPLAPYGSHDEKNKHGCPALKRLETFPPCHLGIDVGSTSANIVLADAGGRIIYQDYLRTRGRPVETIRRGFGKINDTFGHGLAILGVGVTGSGRHMIGKQVGADVVKDEITCQARAAVALDPGVDTVFEIGGQDSKFIAIEDGRVVDFQMNKICAAGTGSFIEEQATKFNLAIHRLGSMALAGQRPVDLGERCTVFIETSIAAHLAAGTRINDIAAGLCYSIVKNYLNRVVGQKRIGNNILFQGAVAYNQGIVNAFRSMTGKTIKVPFFFSVTGAYGAAILAREEKTSETSKFKGFGLQAPDPAPAFHHAAKPSKDHGNAFNRQVEQVVFEGYDGAVDPAKKTVGIPRALFTYGMFPMFHAFFKHLGCNVLLSDPSSEKTIALGQRFSLDETCFPVKLINGHVAELVDKQVDYIFFPDLFSVDHPGSHTRQNYGCAYMQLAFKLVSQAMGLKTRGIELLAPTIAFSLGKKFMENSFSSMGKQLGKSRDETVRAMAEGMAAYGNFEQRLQENSRRFTDGLKPDKTVFVIISKIYGIADPVLNLGIPNILTGMGHPAVPFYVLPEEDLSGTHPNMYWPFGQHILEAARFVRHHRNMVAVFLTHHGCGPDSVLTHYFREIMQDKPYLNIEVDEHSSGVGTVTRIEAFVNSLGDKSGNRAGGMKASSENTAHGNHSGICTRMEKIPGDTTLYLPGIFPYSQILAKILSANGTRAEPLAETGPAALNAGKKQTLTNEYLSLAALLGDAFKQLEKTGGNAAGAAFVMPQTEGGEADGQYSRMLRAKLDEAGHKDVMILAPFIEDLPLMAKADAGRLFLGLLAGDIIRSAPAGTRNHHLKNLLDRIDARPIDIGTVRSLATRIAIEIQINGNPRTILAVGEPMVLYNDFLTGYAFKRMEECGIRVVYAPLGECLWMTLQDHAHQYQGHDSGRAAGILDTFARDMDAVHRDLLKASPFEQDPGRLLAAADRSAGYYAGAFGRYRAAKALCPPDGISGTITVSSTYENTGISLGVLQRGIKGKKPVLDLSFDGHPNENNQAKIESFLYFL